MARSKPERLEGRAGKRRRTITAKGRAPAARGELVSTGYRRGGFGASWRVAMNVAPSFDAVALVDHISDVVMAEHWHAIGEGRRAEGPERQPELANFGRQGRMAAEGQRPDVRGYTGRSTKPFRDEIARSPIKIKAKAITRSRVVKQRFGEHGFIVNETVEGTRAKTTIEPAKIHQSFMALEAKRGNQFFFVKGYVAEAVDRALGAYFGLAMGGVLKKADRRERKAAKAKTR